MKFVPHPGVTRRTNPPANWKPEEHGDCGALEIADVVGQGGVRFMESMWRPNEDEIELLRRGACLLLGISGTSHPVVYLGVTPALKQDGVETR